MSYYYIDNYIKPIDNKIRFNNLPNPTNHKNKQKMLKPQTEELPNI